VNPSRFGLPCRPEKRNHSHENSLVTKSLDPVNIRFHSLTRAGGPACSHRLTSTHTDADAKAGLSEARALDRAVAENIARSLRAMADPTRVQLLSLIIRRPGGRAFVGELATTLGLTQPTVSHHMRIMTEEGLLARSRSGDGPGTTSFPTASGM
jgi:IS5 family transposase